MTIVVNPKLIAFEARIKKGEKLSTQEQTVYENLKKERDEAQLQKGLSGDGKPDLDKGVKVERSQADVPKISIDEFGELLKTAKADDKEGIGASEKLTKMMGKETAPPPKEKQPKAEEPPIEKEQPYSKAEYRKAFKEAEADCDVLPSQHKKENCIEQLTPILLEGNRELEKAKPKFNLD